MNNKQIGLRLVSNRSSEYVDIYIGDDLASVKKKVKSTLDLPCVTNRGVDGTIGLDGDGIELSGYFKDNKLERLSVIKSAITKYLYKDGDTVSELDTVSSLTDNFGGVEIITEYVDIDTMERYKTDQEDLDTYKSESMLNVGGLYDIIIDYSDEEDNPDDSLVYVDIGLKGRYMKSIKAYN